MVLEPFIPKAKRRRDGKGRPWRNAREVINGIIWILFSGSPWYMLPKDYSPYQTCHRYFQFWVRKGIMQKVLGALNLYHASGRKATDVDIADGSFSSVKKGRWGRQDQAGKRSKVMVVVTKKSRPLAISVFSATLFESTLLEETIRKRFAKTKIRRVADRAYDSDPLDERLRRKGIELISPHKCNRRKPKAQDRRKLRHYRQDRGALLRLVAQLPKMRSALREKSRGFPGLSLPRGRPSPKALLR